MVENIGFVQKEIALKFFSTVLSHIEMWKQAKIPSGKQ